MGDFLSASIENWKQDLNKLHGALLMKGFESTSVIWGISSVSSPCWLAAVGSSLFCSCYARWAQLGGFHDCPCRALRVQADNMPRENPESGKNLEFKHQSGNCNSPDVRLLNKCWKKAFLAVNWRLHPSCWLHETSQFVFHMDCHFAFWQQQYNAEEFQECIFQSALESRKISVLGVVAGRGKGTGVFIRPSWD